MTKEMSSQDQSTMTERIDRRATINKLNMRDFLNFASSLLLPLMLGVFTVIITLAQKNDATKQRFEDRLQAREQREQDLNQSRMQRELERSLADQTRNLTEQQRTHEFYLQQQRHQDTLLTNYMTEIGILLKENNGTLTIDPITDALVRLKTLTLIQQLDPIRNAQVIRFLYEAGQLTTNKKAIDLMDVELNGIDLSSLRSRKMHGLYLVGVYLNNVSFANRDLTGANFSETTLNGVDLTNTILTRVDLSRSIINSSCRFTGSQIYETNFADAHLFEIDFSDVKYLQKTQFIQTTIVNSRLSMIPLTKVEFSHSSLENVDFSGSSLHEVIFRRTVGRQVNLTGATLTDSFFDNSEMNTTVFVGVNSSWTRFLSVKLINADFSYTQNSYVHFYRTTCDDISFFAAYFHRVDFEFTNMTRANFTDVHFANDHLNRSIIFSFISTQLAGAVFRRAQLKQILFQYSQMTGVNFESSNLTQSKFIGNKMAFVILRNTTLIKTEFLMNDLSNADLFNSFITNDILQNSLSFDNAYLPDGTRASANMSLIRNGHADCNVSINTDWIEALNTIVVRPYDVNNNTNCYFTPEDITANSNFYQRVNLTRYRTLINNGRVILIFRARLSFISILIYEKAEDDTISKIHRYAYDNKKEFVFERLLPLRNTTILEINVHFRQKTLAWIDDMEIEVEWNMNA